MIQIWRLVLFLAFASWLQAAAYPAPNEGDFLARDFKFASGETMPELRLHYRSLGKPVKESNVCLTERRW